MINGGEWVRGRIETKMASMAQNAGKTPRDANLRTFLRENENGREEFVRGIEQTIRQLYN